MPQTTAAAIAPLPTCPCCEAEAKKDNVGRGMEYIKCSNGQCGIRTAPFAKIEEAIAVWSKRPQGQMLLPIAQLHSAELAAKITELSTIITEPTFKIADVVRQNPGFFKLQSGDDVMTAALKFLEAAVAMGHTHDPAGVAYTAAAPAKP